MTARSELLGKRGEWLLDLEANGRQFRFATAPVQVVRDDGVVLQYREGLNDLEESFALDGSADIAISVTIDASDPWDELVGAFLSFERSPATLRRWFEGQSFERARVLIDGRVNGFTYGDRLEPVSFAVLRQVDTDSRRLPTPGMVVDLTTWPTADDRVIGAHYPVVIGSPGTGAAGAPSPASEGLYAEPGASGKLMVAGHRVLATQVRVFDYAGSGAPVDDTLPVEIATDGVGRVTSIVDMSGFSGTVDVGRNYYIGWDLADGGGLVSPITGGLLRGGADIIEWMLRVFTGVQLDAARFAGTRDRLNAYLFDTHINDPVAPLDWLSSEILPVLPVEPRQGDGGLFYYIRRWDATSNDAVARLDADLRQVQRESSIETRSEQIVNEVAVQFGPNRQTGGFRSRVVVGAFDGRRGLADEFAPGIDEEDPRFIPSFLSALSQTKYGRQPIEVQLNSVWDTGTATRHAQDLLAAQALPRRYVTYSAQTEFETLDVGDVVVLNDSSVNLSDVVALVVDLTAGGPEVELELEVLDDPTLLERS